ncbi:MAG TPA: DUF6252 family protein [Sphingobacteriaceae bacterium]
MKTKLRHIAIIGLITTFAACSKDKNTETEPKITTGGFSAKVENVNFETLTVAALADVTDGHSITLNATGKNEKGILLSIPTQTGTFSSEEDDEVSAIYSENVDKLWMSDLENGKTTVTMTKFDQGSKKMSGTFSVTAPAYGPSGATGTKTITGSFTDVSFTLVND